MKNKKGATLVGSIVSILILSISFSILLGLQASIIKAKFFLQNNNTANLLTTEGLEIVRAMYSTDDTIFNNLSSNVKYKFEVDYTSTNIPILSNVSCTEFIVDNSCDLELPIGANGYKISNKWFFESLLVV